MKKLALAAALAATFATPMLAQAADAKSDWTFAGNAGLFSDYRFRGFTQTGYKFAYQGGFDLSHASGFYLGNWNSNVEQALYNGASLEMDLYGGYKGSFGDVGYDVGYIYYAYPNTGALGTTKIKNGEFYIGGSYGPVSAKYYVTTTKFFSAGEPPSYADVDTKGSGYLDLSGSFDLGGGFALAAHYGYQKIKNGEQLFIKDTVSDYKVGVTKDVEGWLLGAAVIGTSEKNLFTTGESGFTEGAGKSGLVLSVTKSF